MKRLFLIISLIISVFYLKAQHEFPAYRVYFTDKNNSPFSLDRPEEFLSQRAIDKRTRFNIAITEEDLPVSPAYLAAISDADSRLRVIATSKWHNTAVVLCPDESAIAAVEALPFVSAILKVANYYPEQFAAKATANTPRTSAENDADTSSYGYGYGQIAIHNGHLLHEAGFRGEGMLIAVLDAGWNKVDSLEAFRPLFENGQIWGEYDLLPFCDYVYSRHGHGTLVTSEMALSVQDSLIGTAPAANYVLIRSEDPDSEQPIEEDYWVRGAELADSLGADVISSSLGYTHFTDFFEYDFDYSSCDGTGFASIAATRTAHKGIVVCVAAGNEGAGEWHYLSRPSDAADILCVGAVNVEGSYAAFSGAGPSSDGRVKPDVMSVGWNTYFWDEWDEIIPGNGTSCACPIIGGLSACLWQSLPQLSSLEIMQTIREHAHLYLTPNDTLGYGIPDFYQAYVDNADSIGIQEVSNIITQCVITPNPAHSLLQIHSGHSIQQVFVIDITGRTVMQKETASNDIELNISNLQNGIYLARIVTEQGVACRKFVKE